MAWSLAPSRSFLVASLGFQSLQRLPAKAHTLLIRLTSSEKHVLCRAATSQEASEEPSSTGSSARAHLDLLGQLTSSADPGSDYESDGECWRPTIRQQLSELIGDREGDFSLPLGKRLKASMRALTTSQKRNIKRQDYLNKVSGRNDSNFFATIGAFVILPPVVILSIAIATGYVQLLP